VAWNDPTAQPKLLLTMFTVTLVLMIATGLLLNFVTDWPTWITAGIAGGVGGLIGPLITHWVVTRRGRIQATSSEDDPTP
jgi:hypothetical protein